MHAGPCRARRRLPPASSSKGTKFQARLLQRLDFHGKWRNGLRTRQRLLWFGRSKSLRGRGLLAGQPKSKHIVSLEGSPELSVFFCVSSCVTIYACLLPHTTRRVNGIACGLRGARFNPEVKTCRQDAGATLQLRESISAPNFHRKWGMAISHF